MLATTLATSKDAFEQPLLGLRGNPSVLHVIGPSCHASKLKVNVQGMPVNCDQALHVNQYDSTCSCLHSAYHATTHFVVRYDMDRTGQLSVVIPLCKASIVKSS